jgi:tetratricopeptide (TPR) repeat protein
MAIYGFIKAFKDDTEGFVWLIPFGGIIWLVILWQMFRRRRSYAYTLFVLTLIAVPIIWHLWQTQTQIKESKIVVLVAKFDGPEDKYGIRTELIEKLKATTKDYPNIEIDTTEQVVDSIKGSEYARQLGTSDHADIVMWAWYRPTENPNITIHLENLSPKDFSLIEDSAIYQPKATIEDLESFEIQKQIGSETANLVNFLAGYLQYQADDCKMAMRLFNKVLDDGQNIPIINQKYLFLYSGHCLFEFTDYEAAIQQYDQVVQLDSTDPVAIISRGASYSWLGQYERAIQDYDRAIQLDPSLAYAFADRGTAYTQLGQYDRAIQDLDNAVLLDPSYAFAYANRGYSYVQLGQYKSALQDLDEAIQLDPNYPEAYVSRGGAYHYLGQYERAIQDYNQAIQLNPKNVPAFSNRGASYDSLGQYERAIQDYDQAIQLSPKFVEAYINRGNSYTRLGKYENALQDFDKAARLNPDEARSYGGRGAIYNQLGQYQKAIQELDKAIQLNPNYSEAYQNRGYSYYELGQFEPAIQDLDRAILLNPNYAEAFQVRGELYRSINKLLESEADFKKYEELTGHKP